MSKQLALSSALSVLAMSAFALFGSASEGVSHIGPDSPMSATTQAELPALDSLLPSLR